MIFYLLCFIFLLLLWVVYSSAIKPYLLYRWYKKILKNSNYKFIDLGFLPFGFKLIFTIMEDQKKHKDVYYTAKHVEELLKG